MKRWLSFFELKGRTELSILTRTVWEQLRIFDDILVVALGIKGNQIRLWIGAPIKIPIHRKEVFLRMQQEKSMKI
jgi:carbon storage regulator